MAATKCRSRKCRSTSARSSGPTPSRTARPAPRPATSRPAGTCRRTSRSRARREESRTRVRDEHEIRIVPSLFDRLLDDDPENSRDVTPTRAETGRAYRRAVQRDLEGLMNARNPFADLAPEFVEVRRSVLAFGLPDFSAINLTSPNDRERLRLIIKNAIEALEPRLTGV